MEEYDIKSEFMAILKDDIYLTPTACNKVLCLDVFERLFGL